MYTELEDAIRLKIIEHMPDLFNQARCRAGDFDTVFQAMLEENANYGCVLEFFGGMLDNSPPFSKAVWQWRVLGIFMIRYSPSVEDELRVIIGRLSTLFSDDHTLNRKTPLVRIRAMEAPEPSDSLDVPMYWFPVVIEIYER